MIPERNSNPQHQSVSLWSFCNNVMCQEKSKFDSQFGIVSDEQSYFPPSLPPLIKHFTKRFGQQIPCNRRILLVLVLKVLIVDFVERTRLCASLNSEIPVTRRLNAFLLALFLDHLLHNDRYQNSRSLKSCNMCFLGYQL